MTISLKADPSGNFGSILINGTEAIRVNPNGIPASSIGFTPSGNIAANNVQAALQELDSETQSGLATKVSKSGDTMTGSLTINNGFISTSVVESGGAAGLVIKNASASNQTQTTIENDLTSSKLVAHRGNLVLQSISSAVEAKSELQMNNKAISFTNFGENYAQLLASYNANAGSALQYHVVQNLGNIEIHNKRGPLYMQANSSGGVVLNGGATSWAAWSDERMKTALVPITDALTKTCSLRSVTGRYNADDEEVSRSFLIAQDVQAVLPEAVDVMEDGMLTLRPTDVIPLLVGAIKELEARLAALENK